MLTRGCSSGGYTKRNSRASRHLGREATRSVNRTARRGGRVRLEDGTGLRATASSPPGVEEHDSSAVARPRENHGSQWHQSVGAAGMYSPQRERSRAKSCRAVWSPRRIAARRNVAFGEQRARMRCRSGRVEAWGCISDANVVKGPMDRTR